MTLSSNLRVVERKYTGRGMMIPTTAWLISSHYEKSSCVLTPWNGTQISLFSVSLNCVSLQYFSLMMMMMDTFNERHCIPSGRKGMPPVSAPLSDPNAIPNETVQGIVDQCLRTVCCALLTGSSSSEENDNHIVSIRMEEQTTIMKGLASAMMKEGGSDCIDAVVASLSYFRDRIGVPRDMRLPAARQLRAHMNWSIGIILSTSLSSSSSNV